MRKLLICILFLAASFKAYCWGFWAHQKINNYAVFLLPPEMMVLYKPNLQWISEHAVDPDKRRYAVKEEAPRHYLDIDNYGKYPYPDLPHKWTDAVAKYGEEKLTENGIVPWHVNTMLYRLTEAFRTKDFSKIMRYSAEIGHYIADAHVPLHASSNHDGQHSGQKGIHGFWESRIPELLAPSEWDFMLGHAEYISDPSKYIWDRVLESGKLSDSVLLIEKRLSEELPGDAKFSFEERNGILVRQFSNAYTREYDKRMQGMVEMRMRKAIFSVASFWYTAWVNAGQPNLSELANKTFSPAEIKEFESLNDAWRSGSRMIGRQE